VVSVSDGRPQLWAFFSSHGLGSIVYPITSALYSHAVVGRGEHGPALAGVGHRAAGTVGSKG